MHRFLFLGLLACATPWAFGHNAVTPPSAAGLASQTGWADARLSPDGQRVAGFVREGAVRAVVSRKVDGSDLKVAWLTRDAGHDVNLVRWLGNEQLQLQIAVSSDVKPLGLPIPTWRMAAVGLRGDAPQFMVDPRAEAWTNADGTESVVESCPRPDSIVVRDADEDSRSLMRLNTTGTGFEELKLGQGAFEEVVLDVQGRPRLLRGAKGNAQRILVREWLGDTYSPWRPLTWPAPLAAYDNTVLGFDKDPNELIVHSVGPEKAWMHRLSLHPTAPPTVTLLAELPQIPSDGTLLRDEVDCRTLGWRGRHSTTVWADRLDALVGGIEKSFPNLEVRLLQVQGTRYLVRVAGPGHPPEFLMGDRQTGKLHSVAHGFPQLEAPLPLRREDLELTLPDGVRLRFSLIGPQDAAGALPLVLCPNCELQRRDARSAFRPLAAHLASRQRWVLTALEAQRPEPVRLLDSMRLSNADLDAVLALLVRQGRVDPQRVLAVGVGDWAPHVLRWSLQAKPAPVALATYGALTDLKHYVRMSEDADLRPGYRVRVAALMQGDEAELAANSATQQAARLRMPVLVMHAGRDGKIDMAQGKRFVDALKRAGTPVQWLPFEGATADLDHGPYREQAFSAIEALFEQATSKALAR